MVRRGEAEIMVGSVVDPNHGLKIMSITIDAVYEDGKLKLDAPIEVAEGTRVRVTLCPIDTASSSEPYADPLDEVIGICDEGPPVSLASRHDEFVYGHLLDQTMS